MGLGHAKFMAIFGPFGQGICIDGTRPQLPLVMHHQKFSITKIQEIHIIYEYYEY